MTDKRIRNGVGIQQITVNLGGGDISAGEVPNPSESKITDPKKILEIIFQNLRSSFRFVVDPQKPSNDQFLENGLLHRNFLLSDIRSWTGNNENEDPQILEALDIAAETGKLKIFNIESNRNLSITDISFSCEIGQCQKNYHDKISLENLRFYDEKPLKKEEFDKWNNTNISAQVADIRQQIHTQLSKREGKSGLELEARLHREDVMAEIDLKRRMCGMADIPKGDEK